MFGRKPKPKPIDSSELVHGAWQAMRGALELQAADPSDHELWVQVAGRWAAMAVLPPATMPASGRAPMGFSVRPEGFTQDAALTQRAFNALNPLIEAGVQPAFLLSVRAGLHLGWHRFDLAIGDIQQAIALLASGQAEGEKVDRSELERRLGLCRQYAAEHLKLSDRDRSELQKLATRSASRVLNLIHFDPIELRVLPPGPVPGLPEPRLTAIDAQMRAAGSTQLAWTEQVALAKRTGKRALAGTWTVGTDAAFSSGVLGELQVFDVDTLLSDGRILATTLGRGRNLFMSGPWVDKLFVDRCESIDDLIALHRARVAAVVATTPGLTISPVTTVEAYLAMWELRRQREVEYRLTEGMAEAEARGIPAGPPEVMVPMLQAATREAIAQAYANWRAGPAAQAA